ncbi:hypothetical protein PITC_071030 [Penicillium italicum]|uniref:Uncharacterized protein n=1 Tax=Penicillium italicum TaxID=40296 RepID=A0A0A2KNF1_PENIT|nr:hypothetical protein PITC_071030 [Penicillium italicum]
MSESAEQLRKMQILQMADLGTARREMISTADVTTQARSQLAEIESKRIVDERDEAQLSKWANLHTEIGDTRGMEELDDIDSGQSHRANLNAMLHPNGSQPRTYANHPYPTPPAGRGGGVMGKRGRGGFVPPPPPPPTGPANLPRAFASIHLDPALNYNNDDSDTRERGRGNKRGKGKGKGNSQEQVHVPSVPSKPKRPPPAVNFAARISEPGEFMSLFQSRRATGTYEKSSDTMVSTPTQKTASAQKPIPPNEPIIKIPLSGTPKSKTTPSRTVATATKISQPHMGPYLVKTPPPTRVVPLDQTASFKPRKAQPDTPKSSYPHNKPPPVGAPAPPTSNYVSVQQSSKSKKVKEMATGPQAPYPAVVAIATDDIQWKVSPGEEPRKKGTASMSKAVVASESAISLAQAKKIPVTKVGQTKGSKQNVLPDSQKGKPKQEAQSQDLLGEDDSPVKAATNPPHHLKAVAIHSPGAAELAGLKFAEKARGPEPAKSIDEVIAPKTSSNDIPDAQARRNDQSQELDGFRTYGPQIIEELRDIRRHIRSPQDLATTRDIERILESKLLQLVPTAYAPPPAAPTASEIENRLGNLVALVEYLSASQQGADNAEVPSADRRDLTPFERHRSPPPPSSSSNSPPSADKRAHKFESLQVSDKLVAPLQPQRVVPVPTLRPLDIPKKSTTSDASVQVTPALVSLPKEAKKKPRTLNDSIFAEPVGPVTSNSLNTVLLQTTSRGLSANHPNIPKQQDVQSTGARTIGPAPYKPRFIGPTPSPFEPTTLRDVSVSHVRTVSVQHTNTENRPSLDVTSQASSSMSQSSGPASRQAPGRLFSMPDPTTIPQPKARTTDQFPSNQSRR